MKPRSKEYIKGFRHGVSWASVYMRTTKQGVLGTLETDIEDMLSASKEAVKSLRKGR